MQKLASQTGLSQFNFFFAFTIIGDKGSAVQNSFVNKVQFSTFASHMDIHRTIATEHYISEQLTATAPQTPRLFKAGLLTKKVSRMLDAARLRNVNSNHVDVAGVDSFDD